MPDHVLITPLGRSPGAVSGVALALRAITDGPHGGFPVARVVTIGTTHPEVKTASRWLTQLFNDTPIAYQPEFISFAELKGKDTSADSFMIRMGQVLEETTRAGHVVHVGVTSGRSGMGALAALATNIYGADHLWHLWVSQDIEDNGRIDKLPKPIRTNTKYMNPTLAPQEYELVPLPFLDLRPLHPVMVDYYRDFVKAREEGRQPTVPAPLAPIIPILVKMGAQRLADVFPADLSVTAADRIVEIARLHQAVQSPAERETLADELLLILGRFNVADRDTIQRLKTLVRTGGSPEEARQIVERDSARPQFWAFVLEHKDELDVVLDVFGFLINSASLYIQWLSR
jgi:hypothetical protein